MQYFNEQFNKVQWTNIYVWVYFGNPGIGRRSFYLHSEPVISSKFISCFSSVYSQTTWKREAVWKSGLSCDDLKRCAIQTHAPSNYLRLASADYFVRATFFRWRFLCADTEFESFQNIILCTQCSINQSIFYWSKQNRNNSIIIMYTNDRIARIYAFIHVMGI